MAGMDFLSVLPPNIRRRANALKELDEEYLQKVSEAETKSMELNEKYSEKLAPLMKKVDSIISGEYEPEAPPASDEDEEDEEEEKEGDDVKGIPEYWLTVLQNTVSDLISEPDFDLLEKLIAMRTSYKNKGSTVRLEFEFSENDFITEKTLWIELDVSADDSAESAFLDYRSGGIEFKSTDKNLCYEVTEKKQRNKKNPEKVRVVESKKRSSSFFHIFSLDIEEETKETVMELIHFLATEAVPRYVLSLSGFCLIHQVNLRLHW
eukprot:TRINITY_DN4820_c1_g1_i2.p1 TRINITY_DN4820_c1_g1~~TRINITY_DN4820_c1_g1_i2.p1  ORF type:complete len:292 (-),score=104.42 TRINITY_DN4820_c1_g1_i2:223-1014(-)